MHCYALVSLFLVTGCGAAPPGAKLAASTAVASQESARAPLGKALPPLKAKVSAFPMRFGNDDGVEVQIVRTHIEGDKGRYALITLEGADSTLLGLPVLYKFAPSLNVYWSKIDGSRRNTYRLSKSGDSMTIHRPHTLRSDMLTVNKVKKPEGVDPIELLAEHNRLRASGAITKLQSLDRPRREREMNAELASELNRVASKCGFRVPSSIDWESISDEELNSRDHVGYSCGHAAAQLAELCSWDPRQKPELKEQVKSYRCRFGSFALTIADGVLNYSPPLVLAGKQGPTWRALLDARDLGIRVLTDEKGKFVIMNLAFLRQPIWAGTLGKISRQKRLWTLGDSVHLFGGANFAKLNRKEAGIWDLTCGEAKSRFVEAGPEQSAKILALKREPRIWQREPYALARDNRGVYYYVDHLQEEFGGKGYRVFVGKRGEVHRVDLKDIVEDGAGTIFATKTGKLRLVLERRNRQAAWIVNGKKHVLTALRTGDEWQLIYNELGMYAEEDLGTLCD